MKLVKDYIVFKCLLFLFLKHLLSNSHACNFSFSSLIVIADLSRIRNKELLSALTLCVRTENICNFGSFGGGVIFLYNLVFNIKSFHLVMLSINYCNIFKSALTFYSKANSLLGICLADCDLFNWEFL